MVVARALPWGCCCCVALSTNAAPIPLAYQHGCRADQHRDAVPGALPGICHHVTKARAPALPCRVSPGSRPRAGPGDGLRGVECSVNKPGWAITVLERQGGRGGLLLDERLLVREVRAGE
ncbi:hypothetical protein KIL84_006535 [Mauremys mutica]|uniref:Secreted protein n=1 Tax=Mauremys mutica TaxID=74926 RepID=A0A9D3WZI2_9SAUR|nr:hypothetical protein KIL84_006535 [Mauremys mutica]